MRELSLRRVTALVGPFGSGKSEMSIGLALHRAAQGVGPVAVVDLDVIKPYFRSREVREALDAQGVAMMAPQAALAMADLPIITPEMKGTVARRDVQVFLDVGGDPVGARALGSISDAVGAGEHDLLLVLNRHRPFMDSVEGVVAHVRQISAAACLAVTGVISNTHMLEETTEEDVAWGLELARPVAEALGVEVRLVGVPHALAERFADRPDLPPVIAIRRHMLPQFLGGAVLAPPSAPRSRR